MSSLKILFDKIFKYYKGLIRIERILLIISTVYLAGYIFLFLAYLMVTGKFSENFVTFPLILFPIISAIITFNSRTILHGLAFLGVQSFPIIIGVSLFYTQNNACSDSEPEALDNCFFPEDTIHYVSAVLLLFFLILFSTIYCLFLYYLWKEGIWPLIHEWKVSKNENINKMCSIYQLQFPILHAKLMIIGFWITLYTLLIYGLSIVTLGFREGLNVQNYFNYSVPLDFLLILYTIYMIKGVRDESRFMIYMVYFGNIIQAILLYSVSSDHCRNSVSDDRFATFQFCYKNVMFFDIFFIMTILSWIILILSTWNTIRCHKNFDKNVGFYIKYEPCPAEFKYKNLEKRGSRITNKNV